MKCSLIATLVVCLGAGSAAAELILPANVVYEDGAVVASLTDTPSDAANWRKIFANRKSILTAQEVEDVLAYR